MKVNKVYDKVSNYYPNGICSSLSEAMDHTKKLMVFLEKENLLNETGLEELEYWNENSSIESSMLASEGVDLLDSYYTKWNKNYNTLYNTQKETNEYWNRRLSDLRCYNKLKVLSESSFSFNNSNKRLNLKDYLECVDSNISLNAEHVLFECKPFDNWLVCTIKTYDKNMVELNNPKLTALTENHKLFCLDEGFNLKSSLENMKDIWNSQERSFKKNIKIQPNKKVNEFYRL